MSFNVTGGANALADLNDRALILVNNNVQQSTASFIVTVPAGTTATFEAQYGYFVGTVPCTFANRSIWAIPLP